MAVVAFKHITFDDILEHLRAKNLDEEAFNLLSKEKLDKLYRLSLERELVFTEFSRGRIGYASRKSRIWIGNSCFVYRQISRTYPGQEPMACEESWAISETCFPNEDYRVAGVRGILQEARRKVSPDALKPVRGPDHQSLHRSSVWHGLWSCTTWHLLRIDPGVLGFNEEEHILWDDGVRICLKRFPIMKKQAA